MTIVDAFWFFGGLCFGLPAGIVLGVVLCVKGLR